MIFPTTNNIAVHPTQLYEASILILIALALLIIKKRQQFKGQLFLLYISFYAVARSILELFRGDKRGYIIDNYLSHSQFIALLILIVTLLFYKKLKSKNKLTLNN
jgi:phosphatidylglycerol:prolipoprotein diacylglycerol transferase